MRWLILLILLTSCEKVRFFNSQNKSVSSFLVPVSDGTTGNEVVFRGDSITWGVGASTTGNRWTSLLSSAKGWTENNFNMSGYVISDPGACTIRPRWDLNDASAGVPTKTSSRRYLFIAFGVNDHFLDNSNVTSAQYQAAVEAAIDHAVNVKGWQNRRIIILSIYYTTFDNTGATNYCDPASATTTARKNEFIAAAQAAASSRGTNYYNVYTLMENNGAGSLLADNIHPNDAGYSVIYNGLNSFIP